MNNGLDKLSVIKTKKEKVKGDYDPESIINIGSKYGNMFEKVSEHNII